MNSNVVSEVINKLHWESKNKDNSVWNPGGVSLEELLKELENQGHSPVIFSQTPWGNTGEFIPRYGGDDFEIKQREVTLLFVEEVVRIHIQALWHGGINSGHEFEDCEVCHE